MAEEARLESVYASKAHPGFESPSLRITAKAKPASKAGKKLQNGAIWGKKVANKLQICLPLFL